MTTNYSPSQLMNLAERGLLAKAEMADLLADEPRAEFLAACARVEHSITDACAAHADFCLASGCAMDGDVCLNAILNAGPNYNQACARLWLPLFQSSKHVA